MIWLSLSSWCSKLAFMLISGLVLMFVLNGTLGNASLVNFPVFLLLEVGKKIKDNRCSFIYFISGFPVWLKYIPGISFRTDNGPFKVGVS